MTPTKIQQEVEMLRKRTHELGNRLTVAEIKNHDQDKDLTEIKNAMEDIVTQLQNKVDKKMLIWIVGIMFTIASSLLGLIWVEIKGVSHTTSVNNAAIARIEGTLGAAEITK